MDSKRIQDLERQGYRVVGNHSAIKVCMWTRQTIRNKDVCYKNTFYGIQSHRCVQMTPSLPFCTLRCAHCWRDIEWTQNKWAGPVDAPKEIVDGCIKEHLKVLQGFKGNQKIEKHNYIESLVPKHFAISLSGEPTLYPNLPDLIKEIKSRDISSFLVTNGTNPEMLNKLIQEKSMPTQMYLTLPAPNEEIYNKVCNPLIKNGWKKILKSLKLLKQFDRSTLRLTLTKGINLLNEGQYSELINESNPQFLELKGYVWVGYSRQRLKIENMPKHSDIKEFANKLQNLTAYKIIDEKENSRVILMAKKDDEKRVMKFD